MTEAAQVPIGLRVGEYEITGLLGKGGMGTVYAGVHPVIGKRVAIKVLSPELGQSESLVARFMQEARAVNRIGHPNIVDVFAFGHAPGLGHYFVMPLLEGESLGERLTRGPLPLDEAVEIIGNIVDALTAAHDAGVYHRDLKPDNIFLAAKPTGGHVVKVLDFGLAKLDDGAALTTTKTGVPMGTPMFMSPEQWEGVDVDHRTDVYALGVLLFHLVTGSFPFEASTPVALMRAHCDGAPRLPGAAGGPAALDPVVARALAKRKELRYQSARELFESLVVAAGGGAVPMPPPEAAAVAAGSSPASARRWVAVTGAALVLAVAIAVAVAVSPSGAPSTPAAAPGAPGLAEVDDDSAAIRIKSRPKGAAVITPNGDPLGTTPHTVVLPRDRDRVIELILRLPGHRDRRVEITPDRDRYKPFVLEPAGDSAPP